MGKKILFESTENKELGPSKEAKRKKMVLDDVTQSFLPVKEAVKKWNISVSTYYRWRRRYEKSGIAGLKGMSEEKIEETSEERREEEFGMEEEKREDIMHEEREETSAKEETEEAKTEEREEAEVAKAEIRKPTPPAPPEGTGLGLWAVLGAIIGILGILLTLSAYNSTKYYLKQEADKVTIWKGKFHPFSKERIRIEDIKPILLPKVDLGELTENVYRAPEEALNDIFKLVVKKIDEQFEHHSQPDLAKAQEYMGVAKKLATTSDQQKVLHIRMAKFEYFTAIDKMVEGKNIMIKMYREALTHLQKAKDYGLEDIDKIEAQTKEIEKWLKQLTAKPKKL